MDNEIMYIKLDDIIPNRFQPREVFDEESLNKLAESIKQHGLIEPILVRPVSNKYEIIAGERRYKASVLAGLTKIPAMVRQLDDKESSILAFIENEHRSDVSAIEEARTMDRILKTNNMTQEELGKELGVNQSTIANKLRLLNLPLEVQESLMRNEISERHARSLLSVKDENKQIELLKQIKEKRMTVRELDSEIKDMNNMNDNINVYDNNQNNVDPIFMSYLNNYDNSNPLPQEPSVPVQEPMATSVVTPEVPNVPVEEDSFMNFLNNYDNNNPIPQETSIPVQEPMATPVVTPEVPNVPVEEPGFMNFLNNYDNNNPIPQETSIPVQEPMATPVVTTEVPNVPVKEPEFTNFLNNYDNNNPIPQEPQVQEPMATPVVTPEVPNVPVEEDSFMNFLNNYDNNNPVPHEVPFENQEPVTPVQEEPINTGFDENLYSNFTESMNNVSINDVTPPITTDFSNQYIENNPNYVDISKQTVIDDVDEIINRLKKVIDDIKSDSKFKIDTDEINYDDIYQITIKIDKRDF